MILDILFIIFLLIAMLAIYGNGVKRGYSMALTQLATAKTIRIQSKGAKNEKQFEIHPGDQVYHIGKDYRSPETGGNTGKSSDTGHVG